MNYEYFVIGAILLVGGAMGYLYASDQANNYYINQFFYGHSGLFDRDTYKTGSYLFAGLAVLGGALTAAGIFSSPGAALKPEPVSRPPEAIPSEHQQKVIDDATKKEYKDRYIKSGGCALAIAFFALCLGFLLSSSIPFLSLILTAGGVLCAIYGLFMIICSCLAL